jgi:hypothetical protein
VLDQGFRGDRLAAGERFTGGFDEAEQSHGTTSL